MKTAIVIIPTYNENENIVDTINNLQNVFKTIQKWKLQILIVDDSSPDGTAQTVKKLQKKYKNLNLITNKKKSGLGKAYLRGMDEAFNNLNADVVFEFDADMSHDPEVLPDFLEEIERGKDFVLGTRYKNGGSIPQNWGLHRKLLSIWGNKIIQLILFKFNISDWTTGYRAIKKRVYKKIYKQLKSQQFSGYTFQIGFLHKAVNYGFAIGEVPFQFKDRTAGKSKIGPEYIINTLSYLFKVRFEEIIKSRIFKFVIVGSIGALTQLISLALFRQLFTKISLQHILILSSYQLAYLLSLEIAITINFILSNAWTFKDRKLKLNQIPNKFIKFNFASGGSVIIQMIIAILGESLIGLKQLFLIPIIKIYFDTGTLFSIIGILIGMFWNYFAYNVFIWKNNGK